MPEELVVKFKDTHAEVAGNTVTITGTFDYPGEVHELSVRINVTENDYSHGWQCSTAFQNSHITATHTWTDVATLPAGTYYYWVNYNNGFAYYNTEMNKFTVY
jgi:hypothetical protein